MIARICRLISVLGLVAVLLNGCESTTAEDGARAVIDTDDEFYAPNELVRVNVTNVTGSFLYYICDGQIRLQELENGAVINSWLVHGATMCDRKPSIDPGSRSIFSINLGSFPDIQEQARFNSSVRYRFLVDLYADADCTTLLANESDRLSNEVTIVE